MNDRPRATPTEPTGFIKARDVRFQLQGKNVDPAVQHILEALCEQASHQEKRMAAMSQIVERVTDIVTNFAQVAGKMHDTIQNMKGELAEPELGTVESEGTTQ